MLGHLPGSFRDQHRVLYYNKSWTDTIMSDSYYNSHINDMLQFITFYYMLHLKNLNTASYLEYVTEDQDFSWQEIKRLQAATIHCRVLYTWVHASWIEFNNCPTRCNLFSLLHFCRQLYMFRVLTPIIRSLYNSNYSFWYRLTGSTTICSCCWVGTDSCVSYWRYSFVMEEV